MLCRRRVEGGIIRRDYGRTIQSMNEVR